MATPLTRLWNGKNTMGCSYLDTRFYRLIHGSLILRADIAGALLQGRALPHPACQRPLLRRPRGGQPARPHHGGRCQVVG